jgi:hypothetical protein
MGQPGAVVRRWWVFEAVLCLTISMLYTLSCQSLAIINVDFDIPVFRDAVYLSTHNGPPHLTARALLDARVC